MQTSEEENMKIWKLIENVGVDCIKLYEKKNKRDPLEREYEARVDFWNRYIEAQLAKVEFCCDRRYYYELKKNLIYQAQCDLEPIIKILGERKQFENATFIITIDKNKVKEKENMEEQR
jgi:hypothetical protein